MAHKNTDYKPEDIRFPEQKIVTSELVHEMTSSYIEYAMSVIVGRALPDVRDGLKPVHRRLISMLTLWFMPWCLNWIFLPDVRPDVTIRMVMLH